MAIKTLIINNKGGVGKSVLALWLSDAVAKLNKKVLLLTSDNQNNAFHYSGVEPVFKKGLDDWIEKGIGDIFTLHENLSYIPLKNFKIKKSFKDDFNSFMEKMDYQYDYIFIDASPVLGLNEFFIEKADYFVIPTFLDEATTDSIVNLLNVIDKHKVIAVIPNRVGTSVLEKEMYLKLREILQDDEIVLTDAIEQSATLLRLITKGKTVWESKHKKALQVQDILADVLERLEE